MTDTEHTQLREYLDLYVDGVLPEANRGALESHLSSCEECRGEKRALELLNGLFCESRVTVRTGFAGAVMDAVAKSRPAVVRPGTLAAAMGVLFAILALALFGIGGGEAVGFGLVATLADFASSTLLVGGGLLAASWRGLGMAIEEWLFSSVFNLLVGLFLVVALNALALRLVRSRRAVARARHRSDAS